MSEQTEENGRVSDNLNSLVRFSNWWANVGSGITPKKNHDLEEHTERIAEIAWNVARAHMADDDCCLNFECEFNNSNYPQSCASTFNTGVEPENCDYSIIKPNA